MIPNKVAAKCALLFGGDAYSGGDKSDTHKIRPTQASWNPGWHECRHETTIHKVLNAKNHQWNTKKEAQFKCVIYGVVPSLKMGPLGGQSSGHDQSRATHCQNLGCTGPLTRMVWAASLGT